MVSFHYLKKSHTNMKNGNNKKKEEEYIPPKKSKIIAEKEKNINGELFKEYFKYQNQKYTYESLKNTKSTERNKIQVNLIKSALTNL